MITYHYIQETLTTDHKCSFHIYSISVATVPYTFNVANIDSNNYKWVGLLLNTIPSETEVLVLLEGVAL